MEWGFHPGWFTPRFGRQPPINARAETLLARPMWRDAVTNRRCLIPADGFYEWQAVPGERRKQPIYIHLQGGGLFGFAGLYTRHHSEAGDGMSVSCAIITTPPNALTAPIHNRMPAILLPEDESLWLSPHDQDLARLLDCLRPYPSTRMEAYPVSRLVSNAQNDEAALVQPL
jgi:putative SOS response-associated peptidase YedK